MNIYFAGPIRGVQGDLSLYRNIVKMLSRFGIVLTEHFWDEKPPDYRSVRLTDEQIHMQDLSWLARADVVVAEVSKPSLGVGYEIGKTDGEKPILCLFKSDSDTALSAMIAGNKNLTIAKYRNLSELEGIFESFFQSRE